MTDHKPLPVAGYTDQSDAKVALVNEFKQDEERLLRKLDAIRERGQRTHARIRDAWFGRFDEGSK